VWEGGRRDGKGVEKDDEERDKMTVLKKSGPSRGGKGLSIGQKE